MVWADLPAKARQRLDNYLALLVERNKQFNLTAIREPDEIRIRHFEDSLRLLDAADFDCARVLDIGSGAGFPGLVLAIARDDVQVTALDATGKKVAFTREVCERLGLSNVTPLHGRAEELAHDSQYREIFDIVTARGVTALPALCELALPFARIGGWMLAMKEHSDICEIASLFGGIMREPFAYTLPGGLEHTVIRIQKNAKTPPRFPRSWGQIKRNQPAACGRHPS